MTALNLKCPIAFYDLETTGVDPAKDRIVEIAIVKLHPDGTKETYVKRINPEMPIPKEASDIHGIYDDDIKDAPTFKQVAHEIKNFIAGCDLGGYNSNKFDLPALAEEFLRCNIEVDFTMRKLVDVQQIFYKKEPRTLAGAYKFYCNAELQNAHSAEADVMATVEVLEAQIKMYPDLGNNIEALHDFSNNDDFLDYARRIVLKNNVPIFNFGKYKGQSVEEVFKKEPQYYDWMMNADFALHTKQVISNILNKVMLNKK